jgi:hypothetical protein
LFVAILRIIIIHTIVTTAAIIEHMLANTSSCCRMIGPQCPNKGPQQAHNFDGQDYL